MIKNWLKKLLGIFMTWDWVGAELVAAVGLTGMMHCPRDTRMMGKQIS